MSQTDFVISHVKYATTQAFPITVYPMTIHLGAQAKTLRVNLDDLFLSCPTSNLSGNLFYSTIKYKEKSKLYK